MKEGLRSVFAAAGISVGCFCIWLGSNLRESLDIGTSALTASSSNRVLGDLVASRENQTNVPASDYYSQMVSLLKQYYVEPIKDDEKLADGSVRGMVASLGDPESIYMEPDDFRAYVNREKGIYEGIGVDLELVSHGKRTAIPGAVTPPQDAEEAVATMSRFPSVQVTAVVPGGPADKAGVKVGDVVADIDGHWVVEDGLLDKFKKAREDFQAKKLTYAEIAPLQKELKEKTERALLPVRTYPKLLVGKSGSVSVTWNREGALIKTTMEKAPCAMPSFSNASPIVLPMNDNAAKDLSDAIAGRSEISIDLTQDAEGSFAGMMACLQVLAPPGRYGQIVSQRAEDPTPVSIASGNPKPPKIELLVGPSTRGPAAILALALSVQGKATLNGKLSVQKVPVRQDVELPGGAGYDLVVGDYQPVNSKITPGKAGAVALKSDSSPKLLAARRESLLKSENSKGSINGGLN